MMTVPSRNGLKMLSSVIIFIICQSGLSIIVTLHVCNPFAHAMIMAKWPNIHMLDTGYVKYNGSDMNEKQCSAPKIQSMLIKPTLHCCK